MCSYWKTKLAKPIYLYILLCECTNLHLKALVFLTLVYHCYNAKISSYSATYLL